MKSVETIILEEQFISQKIKCPVENVLNYVKHAQLSVDQLKILPKTLLCYLAMTLIVTGQRHLV